MGSESMILTESLSVFMSMRGAIFTDVCGVKQYVLLSKVNVCGSTFACICLGGFELRFSEESDLIFAIVCDCLMWR